MQKKKEDISKKILSVSSRLFMNKGFEDTSLNMIADRCGISKSNIYSYFKSKDEIYETLVAPTRMKMIETIKALLNRDFSGMRIEDKIEGASRVLTETIYGNRQGILIILKSRNAKDSKLITDMIFNSVLRESPIADTGFIIVTAKFLIMGLTDITENMGESKEELYHKLKELFYYHYLGLRGLIQMEPRN